MNGQAFDTTIFLVNLIIIFNFDALCSGNIHTWMLVIGLAEMRYITHCGKIQFELFKCCEDCDVCFCSGHLVTLFMAFVVGILQNTRSSIVKAD